MTNGIQHCEHTTPHLCTQTFDIRLCSENDGSCTWRCIGGISDWLRRISTSALQYPLPVRIDSDTEGLESYPGTPVAGSLNHCYYYPHSGAYGACTHENLYLLEYEGVGRGDERKRKAIILCTTCLLGTTTWKLNNGYTCPIVITYA